ncbi:hypothetical protein DFH08DRAFT_439877 [Mycena albidolilacea]|uniref:Uncharacterized protein n=1 Tax=Mycena albidolilacea TaxID=1033008 RepID=A0AAD7AGH8_9AGAR|nr:hypothetical protein DFH08DRAFT_439877 [Mycena albidolilacea]
MVELFGAPHSSVSSFELLQSGVVDGLLQFATDGERKLNLAKRKELLLNVFAGLQRKMINGAPTPYATFVKKLQESLTRMESFDVVTVAQGVDDSKWSSLIVGEAAPSASGRQRRVGRPLESAQHRDLHSCYRDVPGAAQLSLAPCRRAARERIMAVDARRLGDVGLH